MSVTAYAAKTARGTLERYDYEAGPLGADEVEIRVTHCGICYSDISMIDNSWGFSQYPLVPGHEVIGIITALGAAVGDARRVGQRVGVGWYMGSCGSCDWCTRGKENLCPGQRPTIVGHHGGWASSVRSQAKFAVPIPDALSSENAGPLMCAGSTVFTPMVEFGVTPWMRTAVVGIGGLGHLAVVFLAKFGCEVTAISSSHAKDEDARGLGADHFIATTGTDARTCSTSWRARASPRESSSSQWRRRTARSSTYARARPGSARCWLLEPVTRAGRWSA